MHNKLTDLMLSPEVKMIMTRIVGRAMLTMLLITIFPWRFLKSGIIQ